MSLHVTFLLILVFIAYTLSPTLSQPDDPEAMQEAMKADWFDQNRYRARDYSDTERNYFRSTSRRYRRRQGGSRFQMAAEATVEDPSVRSECRLQPRAKFDAYVQAWKVWSSLVPDPSKGTTEQQIFIGYHRSILSPGAHFGPCFLSFHREYLQRWEGALRDHVGTTSLCYINWLMDRWMPNPCDSVTFSPDYFGTASGPVTTGFAKNVNLYPSDCKGQNILSTKLWRSCYSGLAGRSLLYNETLVNSFINYLTHGDFCYPRYKTFEAAHGSVHAFIGGSMNSLSCAANDPLFVSHHTYIDYLWQKQRDNLGPERETQYPTTWTEIAANQAPTAIIYPFNDTVPPMTCKDGLSMEYDNSIKYEDIPKFCTTQAECGNGDGKGALWCNTSTGKCGSKLKLGGNCAGISTSFVNLVCYTESVCAAAAVCSSGLCKCTLKSG